MSILSLLNIIWIIFILAHHGAQGSLYYGHYSYKQPQSTTEYLYQANLPGMDQLTACFWMKGLSDEATEWNKDRGIISLATSSASNEFLVLLLRASNDYFVSVWVKNIKITMFVDVDKISLWTEKHKHCITWDPTGNITFYVDITKPGVMEPCLSAASPTNNSLSSGGYLILMQDQDSFSGGGLDPNQVLAEGDMGDFNIWDYAMTTEELNAIGCGEEGNIVSMNTLQNSVTSGTQTQYVLQSNLCEVIMEDTSPMRQKYIIHRTVDLPFGLQIQSLITHPVRPGWFIAASKLNLVELNTYGDCYILAGPASPQCQMLHWCNSVFDSITHIYRPDFTDDIVFVLDSIGIHEFSMSNCSVQHDLSYDVPKGTYMNKDCRSSNSILVYSNVSTSTSKLYSRYTFPSAHTWRKFTMPKFEDKHRVFFANHNCSLDIQVVDSSEMDDLKNYVWVGNELIKLESDGRITLYRTYNNSVLKIRHSDLSLFTDLVESVHALDNDEFGIVAKANGGSRYIATLSHVSNSPTTYTTHITPLAVTNMIKSHARYSIPAGYGCEISNSTAISSVPNVSLTSCLYMCAHEMYCLGVVLTPYDCTLLAQIVTAFAIQFGECYELDYLGHGTGNGTHIVPGM